MTRLLLDATAIPADRGGVGRYVDELVAHLPAAGADLHVTCQRRDAPLFEAAVGDGHIHPAPAMVERRPVRLVWEQVGLPRLVRRLRPDVLLCPHYTFPLLARVPTVVTVHDATFFSHPELHLPAKGRFFRSWLRLAAQRATVLVAPSESTRREVVTWARARPDRVMVIPHGVDHRRFRPPRDAEVAAVRRRLGLGASPYLAFLGTLEPRKNVPALVQAWVEACAGRPEPPTLVLAGGRGWDQRLDAALRAVPEGLRVIVPGFVPDDLVPALLGGAEVVVYPSLGEGFGLPVLEAMACGAPVLTTRELSLSEVGGDAVAYAASPRAQDLAAALVRLLDDPATRSALSGYAKEWARSYTWERSALAHVGACGRAASAGRLPRGRSA